MDYRVLNNNTVKDHYPFPLINETLGLTAGATWFTFLDLCMVYWLIYMAKGEEWKTAFYTRYGLYK